MHRLLIAAIVLGLTPAALAAVINDKGRIISPDASRPATTANPDPLTDRVGRLFTPADRPHALTGTGPMSPMTNDKGRRL